MRQDTQNLPKAKHILSQILNVYEKFSSNSLPQNDSKKKAFLKTLWEKKKMLLTSIFSFSHNVFYSIKDRNHHLTYIYFVICKCFQFDDVLDFVTESGLNASLWCIIRTKKSKDNGSIFYIIHFNPLPDMAILGSSHSTENKDMTSKIWTNGDTLI